jgi:antirestriction protein ArdC
MAIFSGDRASYQPGPDRIQLPKRRAFQRQAPDRSGGMGVEGDRGRAYVREELVAELGAVQHGDRLEIGSAMANHASYLGQWLELLKESPRVPLQVLSGTHKSADLIYPEGP